MFKSLVVILVALGSPYSPAAESTSQVLQQRLQAESLLIEKEEKSLRELENALAKAERVKPGGYRIHLSRESLETISKASTLATTAQAIVLTLATLRKSKVSSLSKAGLLIGGAVAIDSSLAVEEDAVGRSVLFHLTSKDILALRELVDQSQKALALYKARREVIQSELNRAERFYEEPERKNVGSKSPH